MNNSIYSGFSPTSAKKILNLSAKELFSRLNSFNLDSLKSKNEQTKKNAHTFLALAQIRILQLISESDKETVDKIVSVYPLRNDSNFIKLYNSYINFSELSKQADTINTVIDYNFERINSIKSFIIKAENELKDKQDELLSFMNNSSKISKLFYYFIPSKKEISLRKEIYDLKRIIVSTTEEVITLRNKVEVLINKQDVIRNKILELKKRE